MKLLRFRLGDDPRPRTGILHDDVVYETDGTNPLGQHSMADVSLLVPIIPTSFRDFQAFEAHVLNTRRRFGRDHVPPEWYEAPTFFFESTAAFLGPEAHLVTPSYTSQLDFELEVGAVIGKAGIDIPVEVADEHILGFTIINDWSARDVQRRESRLGLGPGKAKDFATSLGPFIVTPEELADKVVDTTRGNRYELSMTAEVGETLVSQGNLRDMYWTFAELISHASQSCPLIEGDLIGSGACGSGCLLEHGDDFLDPGDVVTLTVERLGSLRNHIA